MASGTARKHYHDIDGARSVLMFLSVALHAGTVYAPARPWITQNTMRHDFFDWLIFGLHLFITPTFFFVGGFFAVLLLQRRNFGDFLKNRLLRTGVPLLTVALTLNMVENYLRYVDAGGAASFLGWFSTPEFAATIASGKWQLHLWFLVSLIPMFFLSAMIHTALPAHARIRQWAVDLSDKLGIVIAGGAAFALFLLGLAAANFANFAVVGAIPGSYDLIFPGFQTLYKLTSEFPFYVLGVMAALSPTLLASICKWRWWMPYAAIAGFAIQPYAFPEHSFIEAAGRLYGQQLAMWAIVLFILQFFHRYFAKGGAWTTWLADCALSMYLFHHCLIYIYGRWFANVEIPIPLEFTLLTLAAAGTVMILHEGLVRKVPLVRLLFNGKTDVTWRRAEKESTISPVAARA